MTHVARPTPVTFDGGIAGAFNTVILILAGALLFVSFVPA